jgi:anaphase-promoting complex subunit 8
MYIFENENQHPFLRSETVSFLGPLEKGQVKNEALRELRVELSKKHQARELDGFGLYL